MQPLAVLKHGYVGQHILLCFEPSLATRPVDTLLFQTFEETFCNRIIPEITFATHAPDEAMGLKKPPEIFAGILRAASRMDNQASLGPPLPNGHPQCIANQLGLHP